MLLCIILTIILSLQIIKENLQPSDKWKPALKVNQTGRYAPKDSTPQVVVFAVNSEGLPMELKGDGANGESNLAFNNDGEEDTDQTASAAL